MSAQSLLTVRHIRLASGLVMFAYLTQHLLNHALGMFSLKVAEAGLTFAIDFWRNPIATALLYGAAAVHFSLALWTLYSRREWRLPLIEIVRLAAGFTFPLLLIGHAVSARLADTLYDIRPSYTSVIGNLVAIGAEGSQLALFAPGWLHGCLGLWMTLRRFETMQKMKPLLVALVVVIPAAAALGFLNMMSEVSALGPRPSATADMSAQQAALGDWKSWLKTSYLSLIAAAFVLGRIRALTLTRSA